MLPLAIVPARVTNMFEITIIVGAAVDGEAVDDMESCTALAVIALDEKAEAEVKQYMTSKLLVLPGAYQGQYALRSLPGKLGGILTLGSKRYY
jgi:hypothetical protein